MASFEFQAKKNRRFLIFAAYPKWRFSVNDPMMALVDAFPGQLYKALEIARNTQISGPEKAPANVLISGLGGSGIGGTIVSEMVMFEAVCPISVNKDYFAPSFVNEETLAIICSYSGNTEETLQVLHEVIRKKAKVVVISSGGKALEVAREKNLEHIVIPGGMPPRSCLGYSMVQIIHVLLQKKVIGPSLFQQIEGAAKLLEANKAEIIDHAKALASFVLNRKAVIYSLGNTEGVSIRLRQQLNENGKMLCWHHVLPEMNHNELVGWAASEQDLAVIILRYSSEYFRNQKRLEVCEQVFRKYTPHVMELKAKGSNALEEVFYHIHLGDFASCYLAQAKNVDASDISIINYLKNELAKI
jgi:glucose/mannose-6-phosphate isomerase